MHRVPAKIPLVVVSAYLFFGLATARATTFPVAVSPGGPAGTLIGDICPTFSWGAVPGADSYELVVYKLDDENEEAQPVLRETFVGSASSWTPALDRCLERGGEYAWSMRAQGRKEASDWSPPSLFQVASGPSKEEFEAALAVVRRYIDVHAEGESRVPSTAEAGVPSTAEAGEDSPSDSSRKALAVSSAPKAAATTALKVELGVEAASFKGDGSELTNLSPANLAAGTAAIDISGDADTVDGSHAAAFAPASGSPNYVAKAGDTMSGTLTINTAAADALVASNGNISLGSTAKITFGGTDDFRVNSTGATLNVEGDNVTIDADEGDLELEGDDDVFVFALDDFRVEISGTTRIESRVSISESNPTDSPSWTLDVQGDAGKSVGGSTWSVPSDARLKIVDGEVEDALTTLSRLRPVIYTWNEKHRELYGEVDPGRKFGFLAQELRQVLPEFVEEEADGYLWVNLSGLETLLVAAIQELSLRLDNRDREVADLINQ